MKTYAPSRKEGPLDDFTDYRKQGGIAVITLENPPVNALGIDFRKGIAEAIDKAGSDDPIAVGKALEGLTFQGPLGEVQMRTSDHQIQMQLMVSSLTGEYSRPIMYKGNDFHIAFATDGTISREDTTLPTTCDMQRP